MTQSFPNYESPSAAPVKMYLGGEFGKDTSMNAYQASSLYAVDRLCTYKKDLEKFYQDNGIIIMDRYVQSNMLQQAGKIEDRQDVDKFLDWLDYLEFETLKLPRPNKVIFLDVPINVSSKLMEERGIHKTGTVKDVHEENPDHLVKAYNSGKYVSQKYNWEVIPCTKDENMKSISEISDLIWESVKEDIFRLQK
jgi:dTMP kinase